jgi:hypothetical protein
MPNRAVEAANVMDKLHHELQLQAKDVHIVPAIKHILLISIPKFVDTNYIAIFGKDEVNIYNANNTKITVMRATIF